jgi:hypothetical protein
VVTLVRQGSCGATEDAGGAVPRDPRVALH